MAKEMPLGVRLNNPGNIEWGSPWEGLVPREQSRYHKAGTKQQQRFCEFKDPASGIRAIARTLITYADKRLAKDGSPIDTITEVIERWAPSFENNVSAYANHVGRIMGVSALETLDIKDYATMRGLVVGIIAHENAGYAYPAAVVDEGLRRAGLVPPKPMSLASVPLNQETLASAALGITGAAAIVPVLPDLIDAVQNNQEQLTSGDWKQVLTGILSIVLSGLAAWAQAKRLRAGAL